MEPGLSSLNNNVQSDCLANSRVDYTRLIELEHALNRLDFFDNQVIAKINNGQIIEPEASELLDTMP